MLDDGMVSYLLFCLCLNYKACLYFLPLDAFDESKIDRLHPKLKSLVKLLIDFCQFFDQAIAPHFNSLKLRHRFDLLFKIIKTRELCLGHHQGSLTVLRYFMESFLGLSRS